MFDRRLLHHLASWLGQWPPGQPFQVVGSTRRELPGWDGRVHPAIGVAAPDHGVLSVSPQWARLVRGLARDGLEHLLPDLPAAVGCPGRGTYRRVFRWTLRPTDLPDAGEWLPADDPVNPAWLRAFGGEVLVVRDPETGVHQAGVGVKRHNRHGHELTVVTAPQARGRGLARRLIAQAARRALDEGAVPTFAHEPTDGAAARAAAAAGLPDRGWTAYGVAGEP